VPVSFSYADFGYQELLPPRRTRKVLADIVSTSVEFVDPRNPYGQITAANIVVEGPIAELRAWTASIDDSGDRVPESYDNTAKLYAFHILEEQREEEHFIFGLVLSSSDLETYRRVGVYICQAVSQGPGESRYPAENFNRAAITIV
jgi:hypothetical protein